MALLCEKTKSTYIYILVYTALLSTSHLSSRQVFQTKATDIQKAD